MGISLEGAKVAISEIVKYDRELTSQEVLDLESYLTAKWIS